MVSFLLKGVEVNKQLTCKKMAIRFRTTVFSLDGGLVATGPASVAGGAANAFLLPQDTDNVVVKYQASIMGGGASVTFQTSDDGGTTWWDVARTSVVSNAASVTAEWLSIPVVSLGVSTITSIVAAGSVLALNATVGKAGASTLSQKSSSGLPILGLNARVFRRYDSGVTSIISENIVVSANSQGPSN